ncbi:MAG TPA: hypothetical protein VF083_09350 [Acidimicrobiia bacterium]
MEWVLYPGLAVVVIVAVRWLLARIAARGGTSERDAVATTNLILGETNAFRGSRSEDEPPWDGHNRLAPPTVDGHGIGG